MTRGGPLRGPALAIGGAVLLGGFAGWLLGAHPLLAANSGAFAAPAPHKLPRMVVPGAFSPDWDACDPAADLAAGPAIIELTCYASDEAEDAAVLPGDAALPAMAISWP